MKGKGLREEEGDDYYRAGEEPKGLECMAEEKNEGMEEGKGKKTKRRGEGRKTGRCGGRGQGEEGVAHKKDEWEKDGRRSLEGRMEEGEVVNQEREEMKDADEQKEKVREGKNRVY